MQELWEGKGSDRIDFEFISKNVRWNKHDTAMTLEDIYWALYYCSNVEWSLVEEDSAQAGFVRVLPMEGLDPIFNESYESIGQPGRPPIKARLGAGICGGRR